VDGLKRATEVSLLDYMGGHDVAALKEAIEIVPARASIAAPIYALPALSSRPRLYTIEYLQMYDSPEVEYFLVDHDIDRITSNPELRGYYAVLLESLSDPGGYRVVWQRGDYTLFAHR
jgi:hypothetical protein